VSASEAIAEFIHAMELEGVRPVEPIAQRLSSGDLIRFRCDGDGKGRQNGWAIVYLDERPAGAFGNYRLGVSRKWRIDRDDLALSPEERRRLSEEWAQAKQRRAEERAACENEAATEAREMWGQGSPASAEHPYVIRKRLDPSALRELDGWLLIPMMDANGKLWNLQRIAGDGTKRFLRGGRVDGLFCLIGHLTRRGEKACIGEGYATMSAVHRSSGYLCVVAFTAKNLGAVARLWNDARPDLHFIICADDDPELVDNPNIRKNLGLEAAKAAAEEIGAKVAIPLGRAA
jgi:putative DNA primase/helicase